MNAILRPSGDHRGDASSFGWSVILRTAPPFVGTTYTSAFSSPSKSACIAILVPSGENSGLSIASEDFARARSRPVLRSFTYTAYCSPLFAAYARSRPSRDTSKFSSSQIFRR